MNLSTPTVHEVDTRQSSVLTVFDGSRKDESELAKQFWNSVVLMPPVESTLVCKEIKQRTRSRPLNDGSSKAKFPTAMSKSQQEKSLRTKNTPKSLLYNEQLTKPNSCKTGREQHQQLRQLFLKQAKTNRIKHQQWAIPHIGDYCVRHGMPNFYEDNNKQDDYVGDETDRELVRSLPD